MDVRVGLWRKLSPEELMLLKCGVEEDSWESLDCKEIQPVHSILKEISPGCSLEGQWSWNSNTLATRCEDLTHLKRPWCWERLMAGEGDDRGWDGWMASLTQWTWVWVNSRSWWWTGRPRMLQSMGLQRAVHKWATELNWEIACWILSIANIQSRVSKICTWITLRIKLFKKYNAGDPGLIPGSGRTTGEGIVDPLQYSWASLVA